jgi:hypothetical protein
MDVAELARCRALLGVEPGASLEQLQKAYVNRNFALIRTGTELQRQELREAHEVLRAALTAATPRTQPALPMPAPAVPAEPAEPDLSVLIEEGRGNPLTDFENWKTTVIAPPLLFALAWLTVVSPFGFFLKGFHVWMHEFGHAVPAWLSGRLAVPLPLGWTSVHPDFSPFTYLALLVLLLVLLVAGWRERRIWAMVIAAGLLVLQGYMTWLMPEPTQEFWWSAIGGIAGEFCLGALGMALFFIQLPEKFRWGACRYLVFLLCAACFIQAYVFWGDVYRGHEDIPYGTMIHGEDDPNGDLDKLRHEHGWTQSQIRRTFYGLGNTCLIVLGVIYGFFALRLNRLADRMLVAWKHS